MKLAHNAAELTALLPLAQAEAKAGFGDDSVYLERYLDRPRHIEVQLIGDGTGEVIHLGERDCSLQRSHQKILEETPSPGLGRAEREAVLALAVGAMRELGYKSAGTMEFLYQDGAFYFIEMNTRLQVEHPISEMISSVDVVREQLRIAAGAAALLPPIGYRAARPCDRMPHQCRKSRGFPAVAGAGRRIPRAGRARCPRRQRVVPGLHGAAVLRQPGVRS